MVAHYSPGTFKSIRSAGVMFITAMSVLTSLAAEPRSGDAALATSRPFLIVDARDKIATVDLCRGGNLIVTRHFGESTSKEGDTTVFLRDLNGTVGVWEPSTQRLAGTVMSRGAVLEAVCATDGVLALALADAITIWNIRPALSDSVQIDDSTLVEERSVSGIVKASSNAKAVAVFFPYGKRTSLMVVRSPMFEIPVLSNEPPNSDSGQLTSLAASSRGLLAVTSYGPAVGQPVLAMIRSKTGDLTWSHRATAKSEGYCASAFSPDGACIFAAGRGIAAYKSENGDELYHRDMNEFVRQLAVSPDGQWLAVLVGGPPTTVIDESEEHSGRHLQIRRADNGTLHSRVSGKADHITAIALAKEHIVSGDDSGVLHIWDLDGKNQIKVDAHRGVITDISVASDGSRIITSGADGKIRYWSESDLAQRP